MKYIFIIYLFDMLDANILLYKFGQTQAILTLEQNKMSYITGQRERVYIGFGGILS